MDDLLAEFIAETREMLEALGGEIVAWEASPDDKARLDEIFRFVHTVKGNCGFFDLPRLEMLSHAAEDVLADVRSGNRAADNVLVSAVLAIIDRIGELVQALETGEAVSSADDDLLIAALAHKAEAAEVAHAGGHGAIETRKPIRSIRLSVDLLDRMMSGVSDMVLARNELARRLRESSGDLSVENAFERVSSCIAEMRDAITRTRMQRMDSLFVMLPRMVRDISSELGKSVGLDIDGGDVELDREMIEMIRDPLTHIVRNAIDHGIEPAAEREKAGKPVGGTLRVSARQAGNQILIEIGDDGRGIDGDNLANKAVAAGLLTADQAERLSPAQRTALIFEAGLSTAKQVTAISGRGVGMDVVRANIERIGGIVDVESKLGSGVRLTLRVPLTLTIIPALTVSVGGRNYAIPRSATEEIVRVRNNMVRIESLGGSRVAALRDKRIPLVSLGDVLGVAHLRPPEDQSMIVLKPAGGDDYALAVDAVHDHEELVVKPAAPVVMAVGLYAGTTLADDGSPILLLDPSGIATYAGVVLDQNERERLSAKPAPVEDPGEQEPVLLFKTLAGEKRAVRLSIVERIEEVALDSVKYSAGRLRIALGDKILSLAGCEDLPPDGPLRILRLSDGSSELAYGFAEVIDLVMLSGVTTPAANPGEIGGVTLIGGEQIEVIDSFWLFGEQAEEMAGGGALVCALPSADSWMQNILRPLIEAAGYQVVAANGVAAETADLVIASAEADPEMPVSGQMLKIRSMPERSGEDDDSIYRYDRAALLTALRVHASRRKA
ncbi:MAG TPA: chemotaxis protein CheW [Allosphingosinicella sp.]|nr:chemotaxis protein CheW [Allosphingosinicella sp.]